jgi:hydroxypyruvate reductase
MRDDARHILHAAIAAADPRDAVRRALRMEGDVLVVGDEDERIALGDVGRVWLIGAGKAAVGMALAAREVLGERIAGGTLCTKDGHGGGAPGIYTWEAAHPVPDTRGLAAAADALACARAAGERDLVLCLLSGGASALWPAPVEGVSLTELRALTGALLRAGATIREINAVRKHLSRIAGGWLARAANPARVVTLAVSDVVGSPLDVIGGGPTVPDPSTFADALGVLNAYEIAAPGAVLRHLQAGAAGDAAETPKPGDDCFERATAHVVASNADALRGAAEAAGRLGYRAEILAGDLEGEAREVAHGIARAALDRQGALAPGDPPLALILGGETTVTVRGSGTGGRNQELALALALQLEGRPDIVAAALGTDGTDGPTHAAGGIVDGGTIARAAQARLDARDHLARNDSNPLLRATGDLLVTGPTGTNVCDVVVLLVTVEPA